MMLYIEPTTTVGMLIAEINRWLQFKRKTANDASELPDMMGLKAYITSLLDKAVARPPFQEEITSFSKGESEKAGYPFLNLHPNVSLQTMLDCKREIHDDKWVVCICSMFPNYEERTIEEFDISVASIVDEEGEKRLYPVSVSRNGDDITILSWYQAAAALQISIEPDIFKRWMNMDSGYRSSNPICPQCGASIKEQCRERRDQPLHCYECEWDSFKKYDHCSDLGYDLKAFKKEQRYIKQSHEYWTQRNELFEAANKAIDGLSALLPKDIEKFESPQSFKHAIADLMEKLGNMDKSIG